MEFSQKKFEEMRTALNTLFILSVYNESISDLEYRKQAYDLCDKVLEREETPLKTPKSPGFEQPLFEQAERFDDFTQKGKELNELLKSTSPGLHSQQMKRAVGAGNPNTVQQLETLLAHAETLCKNSVVLNCGNVSNINSVRIEDSIMLSEAVGTIKLARGL